MSFSLVGIARVLDEALVGITRILRDGEVVPVGLGGSILAEPRFAVEYIAAIGHLEADQVLTTMMLADELPSEVIQQTTKFDVVATLTGEDVAAPGGDTCASVVVMTGCRDRTGM